VPAGSNAYNSLWQVRTDAWSALEESTAQLALAGAQQRPVEPLTDAVAEALDVLAPIERSCSPDERAQVLARSLARIRPELDLYLMTEIAATTRPAPPPDPPGPALARAAADVAPSTSPDAP